MTSSISTFGSFDIAIVNALRKYPEGLRYNALHRKAGEELGERIWVKTFNDHLKNLVKADIVDRIEETRFKVFYKLKIPETAEAKRCISWLRGLSTFFTIVSHKSLLETDPEKFAEEIIRLSVDWSKIYLINAIKLHLVNPDSGTYFIAETAEEFRKIASQMVSILSKRKRFLGESEEIDKPLMPILGKLEEKWIEKLIADLKEASERLKIEISL